MILCLGTTPTVQRSMTFKRVETNEVNRAKCVEEYASGKSPNVARVLKSLGADPLAIGFAGGGRGRFLVHDLSSAGIRCEFVEVPAETRLCTTVINQADGMATELVEEHAPVLPAAWDRLNEILRARLPASKMWVFSGSLPPDAPADFYARWIGLAKSTRATLILDARGEPLRLALKQDGFIAKLNAKELADTLGKPLDSEAALAEAALRAAPAGGALIVTRGAHGAIASDGRQAWRVTPPAVRAISAVGSGDAFAAGLALGLSRGEELPQALILAAACGAANAMTSRAGHLNEEDVERLRPEVAVSRV